MSLESDSQELEIDQLEALVEREPKDLRVQQKLAEMYSRHGRAAEATGLYLKIADEYQAQTQVQKASGILKQLLKIDPHHTEATRRLAELCLILERRSEAVAAYLRLADFHEEQEQPEQAVWALERADAIERLAIPTRVRLAELLFELGRKTSAVLAYEKVLEGLEEKAYWSDYLKVARRLLTLEPLHLATHKMLARLCLERGQIEESVTHLKQAFEIYRRDPETLEMLALSFDAKGEPEKATAVLKDLADIFEEQGDYLRAQAVYTQILERDPGSRSAINALEHLQVVASLHPSSPDLGSDSLEGTAPFPQEELSSSGHHGTPRPDSGEQPTYDFIRQQLGACNLDVERLTDEVLSQIWRRPLHPGQAREPWPGTLPRRLDGELLYERRYLITDFLGQGLFGQTYRAIDLTDTEDFVCIKRPHFVDLDVEQEELYLQLFSEHATPLLERSHPNLIRVLAVGQTGLRFPYLVTEYFAGSPISQTRKRSPKQIADIFYRIAHTAFYLQSLGLIHGNLSPRNVLVDREHQVKLNDAGLCHIVTAIGEAVSFDTFEGKASHPDSLAVGARKVRGTRGFIAPEVLDGAEPNSASEVFRLGCILYFLAAHQPPPWSLHLQSGGQLFEGVTRSPDDVAPYLPLDDDEHGLFLKYLFFRLIEHSPKRRITLREVMREYVKFVSSSEEGFDSGSTSSYFSSPLLEAAEPLSARYEESVPFHAAMPKTTPHHVVPLPGACLALPEGLQQKLLGLFQRMRETPWFSGKGDPLLGIEYLAEHVRRLQPFSDYPWKPKLSYVRASWKSLDQQIPSQKQLDEVARKASAQTLRSDPHNQDRAGQVAWSALDQFAFSNQALLPFNMANSAVSVIGWSVAAVSDWAAATAAAKSRVRSLAREADRRAAFDAAKSMGWTWMWPRAKEALKDAGAPFASQAAWPISWDASWHAAWTTLSDLEQGDPFEPLFAVWELGLFPLLLHNNDYLLIVLDHSENASEVFKIIHTHS